MLAGNRTWSCCSLSLALFQVGNEPLWMQRRASLGMRWRWLCHKATPSETGWWCWFLCEAVGCELFWLVVWNIFYFSILGAIIPTDFHIFQRGRYTTNQLIISPLGDQVAWLWMKVFIAHPCLRRDQCEDRFCFISLLQTWTWFEFDSTTSDSTELNVKNFYMWCLNTVLGMTTSPFSR